MQSQKPLSVMSGLESAHLTLPLTGWLMRHFTSVVGVLLGVVNRRRQSTSGGRPVAAELVGHQPSWLFLLAFQNLAEKALGGSGIATPLHEDVETISILVNGSPQIVLLATNLYKHFVDVPGIAEPTLTSFQGLAIARPELQAPAANALVRDDYPSFGKQILNIAEAHAKAVVNPNGVTDDLRWKSVPMVAWFAFTHIVSVPDNRST